MTKNSGKLCVQYTEPLDSHFDLIRSGHSDSVYNKHLLFFDSGIISISLPMRLCLSTILLGRCCPRGDHALYKSKDVTKRHIRLIGCAFTMTSLFGIACVQCWPVVSGRVLALHSVDPGLSPNCCPVLLYITCNACRIFWSWWFNL